MLKPIIAAQVKSAPWIETLSLSFPQWNQFKQGMFTLELSSCLLEIPNNAHILLDQNLIGCPTLESFASRLVDIWEQWDLFLLWL